MAAIDLTQALRPNGGVPSYSPALPGAKKPDTTAASLPAADGQAQQPDSLSEPSPASTQALSQRDLALIQALKKTDTEVRAHEMAHIAAGGQYITSGARLEYQRGPDGINYAVAGEVSIDTAPIPGDPEATVQKMKKIKAAALAPASPSAQDRKVAASATALAAKATAEIMALMTAEDGASTPARVTKAPGSAATAYGDMASDTPLKGTRVNISA